MSITLSGNTAFKTAFDGVISKKDSRFVKLDDQGRFKTGHSARSGVVSFFKTKPKQTKQESATNAIAGRLAHAAIQEFAKALPEHLRSELQLQTKMATIEEQISEKIKEDLNAKAPSGIKVKDLKAAAETAQTLVNRAVEEAEKEAAPKAAKTLQGKIESKAQEIAANASSYLWDVFVARDKGGLLNVPEYRDRAEGALKKFEGDVQSEIASFLSSRAKEKNGVLSDQDLFDAEKHAGDILREKMTPKKPTVPAPNTAQPMAQSAPAPNPSSAQPDVGATAPPQAAAPTPNAAQPVAPSKVPPEQVPGIANKKSEDAVAEFSTRTNQKGRTTFAQSQARERIANELKAEVRQMTTDALLGNGGGNLDDAVKKAIAGAVDRYRAA